MNIDLFLSILSTQLYFNFDQYITLKSLFRTDKDFIKNYSFVMSEIECLKIKNRNAFDQIYKINDHCLKNNIQICFPGHALYPAAFLRLDRPPIFLSYKGNLLPQQPCFSVVGSRNPSERVLSWMEDHLSHVVGEYGIISGAARGVDQAAHKIAIRNQKPTIAFLPSGLSQIYPQDFSKWESSILESGGALVSEYAPFTGIMPCHFAQRNRMIATLGLLVFICEAQLRSGTYMTARLAIENHKTLCVLPSFPSELKNAGGLNLIFHGAFPIRDHQDLSVLLEAERVKSTIPNSF